MIEFSLSEAAARQARIAAEAQAVTDNVKRPDRAWAGSLISNLVAMRSGETYIRNKEITGLPADPAERTAIVNRAKHDLRKSVAAAVARAKTIDNSAEFFTESNIIATENGRLFATVFVTRTDVEQPEDEEL